MKAQLGLALLVILCSSADVRAQSGVNLLADSISLNASQYNVDVSLGFHQVGDYLTSVGVQVNHSDFQGFISVTYNTYSTYRNYVAIAQNGSATVKQTFSRASTYTVYFSALVVVRVSGNRTETEYLEGRIVIRVRDVVFFLPNASNCVNLCSNLTAGSSIFNANDVVAVDRVNFINPVLTFSSYYSSYFRVDHTGAVYLRRDVTSIPPRRYSLRITCDYTLTYKRNGNRKIGRTQVYVGFCVLGCPSAEEGNVEWPALHCNQAACHPCSKYHPSLKGGSVVRRCNGEGRTLKLDFSECYVPEGAYSPKFAVVWVVFSGRRGSTYTNALPTIKRDLTRYFSCSPATNVQEFAAYRSNKYYGFTMAFLVSLQLNTTESCLASSYRTLSTTRRLGYQYLRYNRDARGLRPFMPAKGCQKYMEMEDSFTSITPICLKTNTSNCNCSVIQPTPACLVSPDLPSPTVLPTPTVGPQPEIHFTSTHYKANYFSGQPNNGTVVLTVALAVKHPKGIKDWKSNFGLNGYYADFFSIGHTSGVITVATTVRARLYSFDVTAFITGTYANGRSFTNFTEVDVSVFVHDGAYFKDTNYPLSVAADLPKQSQILNLEKELNYDRSSVQKIVDVQFTRVSSSSFRITSKGSVMTAVPLTPRSTVSFTVYLNFQAIAINGNPINGQATTRVTVSVKGCRQEEGGSHVWPVMHPCGIATVGCGEYDNSTFDQEGMIRRQCTKEGEWLTPDFSQCRLRAGTEPFVLLWVTFRSTYTRHWQDSYTIQTIRELRTYMGTLPVSSIIVHYNKESKVVYGYVQSFKITLRRQGPFNDTDLQSLLNRIDGISSISRRSINTANYTFGVLGFLPTDNCPRYAPEKPEPHYKSVCTIGSGSPCSCASDQFEPSDCCTSEGKVDTSEMCNATTPVPGTCDRVRATLTAYLEAKSRQIKVTWTSTSGDWPDIVSVNVFFRGFDEEQHFVTSQYSLTTSTTVTGLLPSTVYLVTVTGIYNNSDCLSVFRTYGVKTGIENTAVGSFQMRLNGVTDCKELKANLQSKVRQQIVSGIQKSDSSFSDDLMGWLFMECPSGLSPSSAVITSWIYGSEGNPASKYIKSMQLMADKSTAIEAGTQKLSMDPSCNVALTAPTPPHSACRAASAPAAGVASLTTTGGNAVAGTVVGIIIGIGICILLALILIVLILKYKGRAKSYTPEHSTAIEPVSLKEAKKIDEDEAPLEEDF